MPVGQRSLANLVARYRTVTESPPTRSLERLKAWSTIWCWQARLAVHEAELDAVRRAEQARLVAEQARDNAKMLQQVGAGALGICALALNRYVDRASGELRGPVPLHTLPSLMNSGAQLIQASTGQPANGAPAGERSLDDVLCIAPEQTRATILQGLRALADFQERSGGAS
jgi:hypothetical protein